MSKVQVNSIENSSDDKVMVNLDCPVRGVELEVHMTPQVTVTTGEEEGQFITHVTLVGTHYDPPIEYETDAPITDQPAVQP